MINKTSNSLDRQLMNRIAALEQQMKDIKAPQPIGGGNLKVTIIPGANTPIASNFTLTAGSIATLNVTFVPGAQTLTLWNFLYTIRVDVDDNNHNFPGGSSLTSAQRSLRESSHIDYLDSSDTTNTRVFKVRVENYDTASHTYYVYTMGYIPLLTASGS